MELLGRYSSWAYWTDRLPNLGKAGERRSESRSRVRMTARRLSERDVSELVAGYREGATVYELAERFRIHRATVSEHLHRRGVRMRGLSLEQRQVDEAIRLYEQGWSVAKIGRDLGVNGSTVWRALRKEGLRMRDSQGRQR